jgi:hypothetical protein
MYVHQQIGLLRHADVADFEIGAAVARTREYPLVIGGKTGCVTNALQRPQDMVVRHARPMFAQFRSREFLCVFITAVPITKLFACVWGETMEDMCYERLRAEACVD